MDIPINITNKHPAVIGAPVIVCGNSDYTITFTFDSEWSDFGVKTARFVFVQDGVVKHTDVVFDGNIVEVPVLSNIKWVQVGVFAEDIRTTTSARIPCELSIRCGTPIPEDPTPSQYDQIIEILSRTPTQPQYDELADQVKALPTIAQYDELSERVDALPTVEQYEELTERVDALPTSAQYEALSRQVNALPTSAQYNGLAAQVDALPTAAQYEELAEQLNAIPISPEVRFYKNVTGTITENWNLYSPGSTAETSALMSLYNWRATAVLNLDEWFKQNGENCIVEAYLSYVDQKAGKISTIIEPHGDYVYLYGTSGTPNGGSDYYYCPTFKWIRVTKI